METVFVLQLPEFDEVKNLLSGYEVYRFRPTKEILEKYMDGGVAIIDQWICAHARWEDET